MYTPRGKKSIHIETYPVPPIAAHPRGQDGGGPEGVKQRLAAFREAFPDMVWTLEDLVADEAKPVARSSMNATHQGGFMGIAPTGRWVTLSGNDIYRIVGSQLTEHWHEIDALGLMQQLGIIHMPVGRG